MRLTELLLFLAPVAAFIVWRLTLGMGGPPRIILLAIAAALVLLVCLLVWLTHESALPPHTVYVPAQLQNGRVIPGHGNP